ncbi:MAG: shikimate dehydrogenase, partial [Muribaculaceae bacterium]|nr:shikimate dehydrogenase [Muribaculaceae bacterium]
LGTAPNVDMCPDIPYDLITENHICYDLVYNPTETLFMKQSAVHGAKVKNGAEMLKLQALLAWRIWTGESTSQ